MPSSQVHDRSKARLLDSAQHAPEVHSRKSPYFVSSIIVSAIFIIRRLLGASQSMKLRNGHPMLQISNHVTLSCDTHASLSGPVA